MPTKVCILVHTTDKEEDVSKIVNSILFTQIERRLHIEELIIVTLTDTSLETLKEIKALEKFSKRKIFLEEFSSLTKKVKKECLKVIKEQTVYTQLLSPTE